MTVPPLATVVGETVVVVLTCAWASAVFCVEVLEEGSNSVTPVGAVIVAVAVAEDPAPNVPLTVITAPPLPGNFVRVPNALPLATVKVPHTAPAVGDPQVTVTPVAPAGAVKSTRDPSAAEGPRLETAMV